MKSRFVGAFSFLFLGTHWAVAQAPVPPPSLPPASPPAVTAPAPSSVVPAPGTPTTDLGAASKAVLPATAPVAHPAGPGLQYAPAHEIGETAGSPYFTEPVGDSYRAYVSADYLLWRIRKPRLPATTQAIPTGVLAVDVTDQFVTSPTGTPTPGSRTLIGLAPLFIQTNASFGGGPTVDLGEHSGGRFTAGFWLDPHQDFGVETSWFFLDKRTGDFNVTSANQTNQFLINTGFTQNVFLLTPSTTPGVPPTTSLLASNPVLLVREATSTLVGNTSSSMWGGELNGRSTCLKYGGATLGGLIGFRYLNFSEELTMNNTVVLTRPANPALQTPADFGTPPPVPARLDFTTSDLIRTHNHFYGGQVGADLEANCGRFFLYARGKVGVGVMHQNVTIDGSTTSNGAVTAGGLLSSPQDIGTHSRNRIAFIPEANIKLGYNITSWLRGYVGYDVLYITQVARPADQTTTSTLTTNVNVAGTTNTINVSQPTFRFRDTDLLTQGLNFGLEVRY